MRIIAPTALAPKLHLAGEIGGGLARKRRIGGAAALAPRAVAAFARREPAPGIAGVIEGKPLGRGSSVRIERQSGVVERHRHALALAELPCDPAHLCMLPPPIGIRFKLSFEIPRVEAREPRRPGTIAARVQTMAGEAGVGGACPASAERDHPPVLGEPRHRNRLGRAAAGKQRRSGAEDEIQGPHMQGETARRLSRFRYLLLPLAMTACKPPPNERQSMPLADTKQGKIVIERVGCASCHIIPGIGWPKGKVGPGLDGIAGRALIAGQLPNRPDVLAAYIRRAPALVPGSGMPAMPVTEVEARNVAAYLYEKGAR